MQEVNFTRYDWWISRSSLSVSVYQGSLVVNIIMIDSRKKRNRTLGFEAQSSHVVKRRNKNSRHLHWELGADDVFQKQISSTVNVFSPFIFSTL